MTLEEWIAITEECLTHERDHLASSIAQFGRTVKVVGEKVAKGGRMNTLGEFQSTPTSIDCRLASIQGRTDMLAELKAAVATTSPVELPGLGDLKKLL